MNPYRAGCFVAVAVITTLAVGIAFVIDPWPVVVAWLGTLIIIGPLVAWGVDRHRRRPSVEQEAAVSITYNVLNLPDRTPGVGGAVYRQLPGPSRVTATSHQEALTWPSNPQTERGD